MVQGKYTFGDNEQASARLKLLSKVYEQETRELLERTSGGKRSLAVDLGCGPGWSTCLIRDVLRPLRTVGLDSSEKYVTEARENNPDLEFAVHDIATVPFPLREPDLLFCRFLLTHLRAVEQVLRNWASVASRNAVLVVHETESLETEHPALRRYYELVAQLQKHYGQVLMMGAVLEECFANSGWLIAESKTRVAEKRAGDMAKLHVANLRTWRHDPFASDTFDPSEIDRLEVSLDRIARVEEDAGVVVTTSRQIIARRA